MAVKIRQKLIDGYREHWLEEGRAPASVYRLCKNLKIKEGDFYKEFSNLNALEGAIWDGLLEDSIKTVEADEEFADQSAQARLLSLYFTFLELAKDHRSFLILRFPEVKNTCRCSTLRKMQHRFEQFIKTVHARGVETGEVADRGKLDQFYPKLGFGLFLFVLDFYLKDESDQFERTDALVEKSVHFAFTGAREQVFDSAFDLFRFLAGRSHE